MSVEPEWKLYVGGQTIAWSDIESLANIEKFSEHKEMAPNAEVSRLDERISHGSA